MYLLEVGGLGGHFFTLIKLSFSGQSAVKVWSVVEILKQHLENLDNLLNESTQSTTVLPAVNTVS